MKKGLKESFKELAKHFLNIAVAVVVFAILQPLIRNKFDLKIAVYFSVVYFALVTLSVILIMIGSDDDE